MFPTTPAGRMLCFGKRFELLVEASLFERMRKCSGLGVGGLMGMKLDSSASAVRVCQSPTSHVCLSMLGCATVPQVILR